MFAVSEAEATVIRDAFNEGGERSASVALRRLFPALADNENTRICARSIAGWSPLPMPKRRVARTKISPPA